MRIRTLTLAVLLIVALPAAVEVSAPAAAQLLKPTFGVPIAETVTGRKDCRPIMGENYGTATEVFSCPTELLKTKGQIIFVGLNGSLEGVWYRLVKAKDERTFHRGTAMLLLDLLREQYGRPIGFKSLTSFRHRESAVWKLPEGALYICSKEGEREIIIIFLSEKLYKSEKQRAAKTRPGR
jgi:hypothetical protein